MDESPDELRGQVMTDAEYLTHLVLVYCASPANTPEEGIAKALLELACARFGVDPEVATRSVMTNIPGGRVVPSWAT